MKRVLLLFLFPAPLPAQTISISGPSGLVKAGSLVTLTISISGTGTTGAAAAQFSVSNLSAWTITAATPASGKSVNCATVSSALNCVVVGTNATPLTDGQLATLKFTLPRNAPSGNTSIALTGTLASNPGGNGVTVGAGGPFVFGIASLCDLNSDGAIDQSDLTLAMPQVLKSSACTTADLNSDSICDVRDAQIIGTAAAGGMCNAQ